MRILSVHSPSHDFLHTMLLYGLRRLGVEVIEAPAFSPGFEFEAVLSDPIPDPLPLEEIRGQQFDICLVGTRSEEWLSPLENLTWSLPRVLVDGRDDPDLQRTVLEAVKPNLIFKREFLFHRDYPPNCFPLPFASLFPVTPSDEDRPLDVVFLASDNHPRRHRIHQLLTCQEGVNYFGRVRGVHPPWVEYMRLLQRAKIGITVRGFGYDTVRFWEILASGCLLVAEETLQQIPHDFVDEVHLRYFDENTLPWIIGHYLYHEEKRQEVARAGQQHMLKYHTVEARAQYFLDVIQEEL